jgi:hypothetical protein
MTTWRSASSFERDVVVVEGSVSISRTSTSSKPASISIDIACCLPHMLPSPVPPPASDTVMQCMVETVYDNGAQGILMLSSRLLEALISAISNAPPGRTTDR